MRWRLSYNKHFQSCNWHFSFSFQFSLLPWTLWHGWQIGKIGGNLIRCDELKNQNAIQVSGCRNGVSVNLVVNINLPHGVDLRTSWTKPAKRSRHSSRQLLLYLFCWEQIVSILPVITGHCLSRTIAAVTARFPSPIPRCQSVTRLFRPHSSENL